MKAELLKTDQSWVALITMNGRTFQMTMDYSKTESEAQKVIDSLNTCFECERLLEQLIGGDEIKRMVDGYITARDIREAILIDEHGACEPETDVSYMKLKCNCTCSVADVNYEGKVICCGCGLEKE